MTVSTALIGEKDVITLLSDCSLYRYPVYSICLYMQFYAFIIMYENKMITIITMVVVGLGLMASTNRLYRAIQQVKVY